MMALELAATGQAVVEICGLTTSSSGVTWVCVNDRHGGADPHRFRDEADL